MSITLVAHTASGTASTGTTTAAIDTTGASLLVVCMAYFDNAAAPTPSDSKGNTWTQLSTGGAATFTRTRMFCVTNPTVGSGHTVTVGGTVFASVVFLAFSGTDTSQLADQQNGSTTSGSITTVQPGSVTPSVNGELIVTGVAVDALETLSIGSGFTIADSVNYSAGNNMGGGGAYLVQGAAAAVNPSWSWGVATDAGAAVATFKAAPAAPPTVVTGAASAINATGATLNATVNPNGKSTTAQFEYGLTTGYGTTVSLGTIGSDSTVHAVSTILSGLTTGLTYHFRIVATNSDGTSNGSDATFIPAAAAAPAVVSSARPPLELVVEVTDASGTRYRWDSEGPAKDRPQGLSFSTKRGDGFAQGGCTLARRVDQDHSDLGLYDEVVVSGADGSVAYEGRVSAMPRSLDETGHSIAVAFQSWMTHAKDRKFTEVYVGQDFGAWGDMPLNEKARLGVAGQDFALLTWSSDAGGLVCPLPAQSVPNNADGQAWYTAPPGVTIAKVMYVGSDTTTTSFAAPRFLYSTADDWTTGAAAAVAATFDGTLRTATAAAARRYVIADISNSSGGALTPASGSNRRISKIGVYGNHGLTTRSIDATTPDGVYASDVISDIARRFCPKLNTSGVQATTYAIPHLAFKDPAAPFDAFLECNKFHLWDLGVWENKTLTFRPFDLTDYDWEIRLDDPGVTVEFQGDSTEDLFNGICVTYPDLASGSQSRITPDDDSTLADTSVTNPANSHGIKAWDEATLSSPTTAAAAAQIGRALLAEKNAPKAPGTYRVRGHIKDRAGHWQPVWKVRAGDTVSITSSTSLSDRPHLIVETSYSHDDVTVTIGVDNTLPRVDAVMDRLATDLAAANLG